MKVTYSIRTKIEGIEDRSNYLIGIAMRIRDLARYYAPVKTGFMRDNIVVAVNDEGAQVLSLAEYSIFPHEVLEYRHKPPTRAKFLEGAAYEIGNQYKDIKIDVEYYPVLKINIRKRGEDGE